MNGNQRRPQTPGTGRTAYDNLFRPRSIAVIGASNDTRKPGGRLAISIRDHRFGGALWAVNPKTPSVLGLPTFPDIPALPRGPDLAIVAIPAPLVLSAVKALAGKGTGAAIVLTSGFGEKDAAGKRIEGQMSKVALEAGMALVGPNCSGFLTKCYKGKFAGLVPTLEGAAVDFISGSGATVDYLMEQASGRGLSFGNVVNLGNSVQIGVEEMLAMFDENHAPDSARILLLYMESIRKPALLLRHARSLVGKGCAIVGIKSGATTAGARAAASHTGAMASPESAVQALFEKAGIMRVRSKAEMIDVACMLAIARGRLRGRRACIVTDAGGPGVMLSDELNRQGWDLPALSEEGRRRLRQILPPESALGNPIDCLPSRSGGQIRAILEVLAEEENGRFDLVAMITGDSGLSDNSEIYREIGSAIDRHPLPVAAVLSSATSSRAEIEAFSNSGKPFFCDEVSLGIALGHIGACTPPRSASVRMPGYDRRAISEVLAEKTGLLAPQTAAGVLRAAGFMLPEQIALYEKESLAAACRRTGYPLAMKVIGPLHKSDSGGVRLGLKRDEHALEAWDALLTIPGARGVVLQPMIEGREVILGACREGEFGHLLMFGLGGIFTEILKDVRFALAPVGRSESMRMIEGIRAYPLLKGLRGEPGMSIDLLADCIQRLSLLVTDFPRLREIDLNPIKGYERKLYAVDARMLMD